MFFKYRLEKKLNYRIKFIDMMPNSSFLYKLKYMGSSKSKNKKAPPTSSTVGNSTQSHYYFTLDSLPLPPITSSPDPPTRSTRKKRLPKQCSACSSATTTCSCHASFGSSASRRPLVMHAEPRRRSSSCCWGVSSSADADLVLAELAGGNECDKSGSVNADGKVSFSVEFDELDDCFRSAQLEMELPPILAEPPKFSELVLELKQQKPSSKFRSQTEEKLAQVLSVKTVKEDKVSPRKSVSASRGVRVRSSSSRIVGKRMQPCKRSNGVSDGIAVMKSSSDPLKDFRESMMEMIVENNIRGYKELEDLLACYLSLNSSEYHDAIVQVFAQIWLDHLPLPH